MAKVTAASERTIDAPADRVRDAVMDYSTTRPRILTDAFYDYSVLAGGIGAGTRARWKLQATSKRVRDIVADVSVRDDGTVAEDDENSSMVITWAVRQAGERSTVRVEASWDGAGGIGGFFERMFAPKGLQRIYDSVLDNLDGTVSS